MSVGTVLMSVSETDREAFSQDLIALAGRLNSGTPMVDDPIPGDPVTGLKWLKNHFVTVHGDVTGIPIYLQTMSEPCIMLPPFALLKKDSDDHSGYKAPDFYCAQCGSNGDRPFYLKRLSDYTLSHCG